MEYKKYESGSIFDLLIKYKSDKESLAKEEREQKERKGFWNNINNEQYSLVLKAKGEKETTQKVKEFLTRNYLNERWRFRNGEGHYPLAQQSRIGLYMKFFNQWYKPFIISEK